MYNKTIIEFGFRMISWIIKTSCLCYLPQPSASADQTSVLIIHDIMLNLIQLIIKIIIIIRRRRSEYWWIFPETKSRGIFTNIHEPEANNCYSIITQVIIEIPKRRNDTFLPQFAIVHKSSHHAAQINVSRNAFLNSHSEEKNIFFDVRTG